jgi:dCTP deaminase
MILSGKEIENRISKGTIIINPFNKNHLGVNSYDLTLAEDFMIYSESVLDIKKDNRTRIGKISKEGKTLYPGILYLCRTNEYTETYGLVPMIEGRSSIGRLGIFTHVTAGFGDVGFCGYWTLEITCIHPVIIYPNIKIAQIYFLTIEGDYDLYKSNKYQNSKEIRSSQMYKEFE